MNFSELTTLKIGGPIKEIRLAKSDGEFMEELSKVTLDQGKFMVIGGGSNLLVSDDGFDGLVIKNEVRGVTKEGKNLVVKSGTILQDLVDFANREGLSGLESLAGIPGTVGGAIYGNAGAYGQTISDHLINVKVFDVNSKSSKLFDKNECEFAYRYSVFKKNKGIILEVVFGLTPSDSAQLETFSKNIIQKREIKYPPGIKCPGSFFKNIIAAELSAEVLAKIPEEKIVYGKVPAGTLLEMVGAKGDFLREIEIAPYHANLFINKGEGTAKDFYILAKKYFDKVKGKFGIELEPEVQLINLPSLS